MRGIGWEYVHVAIGDCTRVGYAEVLAYEQGATTVGFLERAFAWYATHGVTIRRLLTDNGGNYRSDALAACCRRLRIRQHLTRPYRPKTNGKAERFIRTLLHEWAYAQAFGRSLDRTRALPRYLYFYNAERRHTALQFSTPLQRLAAKQ
ncbi:MAG: DDE-type integrase/transposase/recombinase [Gemmatimonadaceae bacterium]